MEAHTSEKIETRVETEARDAYPSDVSDADAFAVVESGDLRHVQAVWEIDETTVEVMVIRCNGSECELINGWKSTRERFDIAASKEISEWSHEAANIDPVAVISSVRNHYN